MVHSSEEENVAYEFVLTFPAVLCVFCSFYISSPERDIDIRLVKAWNAIDKLSMIWKNWSDTIERDLFQAAAVSLLLFECTAWMLTKLIENRLHGNDTRMLCAVLNKSWKQLLTKHQVHSYLPLINLKNNPSMIYIYIYIYIYIDICIHIHILWKLYNFAGNYYDSMFCWT